MTDFGNVSPIRSDPDALKPKAKALLSAATWSGEFEPSLHRDYLIKGWLEKGTLAVMFGPSNVGKSFLALDLAHHISKGISWAEHRITKGNVLYIAAEGGSSFPNRVSALDEPEFWVITMPVTFAGKTSDAAPMVEMVQHLASQVGRFDLIVVDTLSRVMGDGDENTAPDIADLIRNLDVLRQGTGSNVMLVHHTGKDIARGARGHSSLRAAIDTEIELSRDDKYRRQKTEGYDSVLIDIPVHPALEEILVGLSKTKLTFLETSNGSARSPNGLGNLVRKWCDEAGLPQCTSHGLRKACATRLAEAGATEREIMAWTGHKSPQMVQVYAGKARRGVLADNGFQKLIENETGSIIDEPKVKGSAK